jgi:hypothetical protein
MLRVRCRAGAISVHPRHRGALTDNNMTRTLLGLLTAALMTSPTAWAKPSAFDLIGKWETTVEFGKFKVRVIVKVTRSPEGRISGKIDVPDQGAKDIPVSAMLCNYPKVRWEIDPLDNTAFNGTVDATTNSISGEFEEGPGGRPLAAVFRRLPDSAGAEPKLTYAFGQNEPRDIRGFWKGQIEFPPEPGSRVGLRIGRAPTGTFGVLLDLLDRGAHDVAASSVQSTNQTFQMEWQFLQIAFQGKLESDGDRLSGLWQQNGKTNQVTFERLARPATLLPENLSFTPKGTQDMRGYWKGVLEVPGNKLRILFKIGTTPTGEFAGTLISPDQGDAELPLSSATLTNSNARLEWKSIRGVFKGILNKEGTVLDGTWEQMGPPLTLKMERTGAPEKQSPAQN